MLIPDSRFSFLSTHRFTTTLLFQPLARAFVSNNLEPNLPMDTKPFFLEENFANPRFVRIWSDLRAFDLHLWQCLLGLEGHSKIFSVRPSSTAIAGQNTGQTRNTRECLIAPRQHIRAPWRLIRRRHGIIRYSEPVIVSVSKILLEGSFPYRRGGGLILALHWHLSGKLSRFPFARHRRFRPCFDIVCDTLTGRGVVKNHDASRSCGSGGTGAAQREANQARCCRRLISRSRHCRAAAVPLDCGTFLAALTERLFRRPARGQWPRPISRPSSSLAFDYHLVEKLILLEATCI